MFLKKGDKDEKEKFIAEIAREANVASDDVSYDTRINDYINAWGDEKTGFWESDFGGIYEIQLSQSGSSDI